MNDESLHRLLRDAGRDPGPLPQPRPDLPDRVRHLAARRRRRRRLKTASAAAVLLLGAVLWPLLRTGGPPAQTERAVADVATTEQEAESLPAKEIERLLAEVARLDAEVQRRQETVRQMLLEKRLHAQSQRDARQWGRPDDLELARVEIEKTAFLLVEYADQQTLFTASDDAARQYERILKHFPHTKAAATAQEKLENLVIEKGTL